MKIAVGGMAHETNTFTETKTEIRSFNIIKGDKIFNLSSLKKKGTAGGIIQKLKEENVEIVPTQFASTIPSGIIKEEAYKIIKDGIVNPVKESYEELDGICLALHGSMYVEGLDDPEGELLAELREIVGTGLPIICALDMHATVTGKMIDNASGFTGYKTAPHIDAFETGMRAAEMLLYILQEGIKPYQQWVRMPMLLAGEQSETDEYPMNVLIPLLEEQEREEGIFSCSYLLGFPWADSPHNGVNVVVVGDNKYKSRIDRAVSFLAREFWDKRFEFDFTTEAYPLSRALTVAVGEPSRPVVVSDTGDNPTAGASEDLTIVVQKLLDRNISDVLVAVIADPQALEQCCRLGEGKSGPLSLGRKEYKPEGAPLTAEAEIIKLDKVNGVKTALITVRGVTIIITEERIPVYDPQFLTDLEIVPQSFEIIIIKCGYLSPEYQKIASRKILALTPGDTNEVLTELSYQVTPRPIFPLDQDVDFEHQSR